MSTSIEPMKSAARLRLAMPISGTTRLLATGVNVRTRTGDLSATDFVGGYNAVDSGDVRSWEPDH